MPFFAERFRSAPQEYASGDGRLLVWAAFVEEGMNMESQPYKMMQMLVKEPARMSS